MVEVVKTVTVKKNPTKLCIYRRSTVYVDATVSARLVQERERPHGSSTSLKQTSHLSVVTYDAAESRRS